MANRFLKRQRCRPLPVCAVLTSFAALGLTAPAVMAQQSLYSTDFDGNQILEYSTTNQSMSVFASGGPLLDPEGLAFGSNGALYVSAADPATGAGDILQYNINAPGASPVVVAEGDSSSVFGSLAYHDGSLYVSDSGEDSVLKLDGGTLQTYASGDGLTDPTGLAFDGSGNLFVSSADQNSGLGDVLEFNSTGAYDGTVVAPGAGGLNAAGELAFVGGSVFVANGQGAQSNGALDRFSPAGQPDGTAGNPMDATFGSDPNLVNPYGLAVAANGDFFVGDQNSNTSLDPNNASGGQIAEFGPSGQFLQYLDNAGNPYGLAVGPPSAPEPAGPVALLIGAGLIGAFGAPTPFGAVSLKPTMRINS